MFPPRLRKAEDESLCHGIADGAHDDRDSGRRLLRSLDRRRIPYHNDIHWQPHELVREGGKPAELVLRPSILDRDVLGLYPAKMVQLPARRTSAASNQAQRAGSRA